MQKVQDHDHDHDHESLFHQSYAWLSVFQRICYCLCDNPFAILIEFFKMNWGSDCSVH